jgi:hypothetical protein
MELDGECAPANEVETLDCAVIGVDMAHLEWGFQFVAPAG